MNISIKPKNFKTQDGYFFGDGTILYQLRHNMFGCWIYKFKVKHWHNGGIVNMSILYDSLSHVYEADFKGLGKGFYPEKETNPYSFIHYLDVYGSYNNAKEAYRKRLVKMTKYLKTLNEKSCKMKKKTYE